MHVLMIALIDETVVPSQDDVCEILDAARSLARVGVSVTMVMNRRITAGFPVSSGNGRSLAAGVSDRRSTLELISVPRLGVIPVRRAAQMPLAVILQADLSVLAEVTARWERGRTYDLIHCFGWRAAPAAGLLARMMSRPLVASVRDTIADRSDWLEDPVDAYSRHVWRWLLPLCQAVICPDEYQREKINDLFLAGKRNVHLLPSVSAGAGERKGWSGSGAEESDPSANSDHGLSIKVRGDEKRILCHAPCGFTDGSRKLLQAMAGIKHRSSDPVRLFLAGPARRPDHRVLTSVIRRLDLADRIIFLEPRAEPFWWDAVLSAMDLMILNDPVPFVGNLIWKTLALECPLLVSWESPLASWLRDRGLEKAVWQTGQIREDRYLERALFDKALRERLSGAGKNLIKGIRPLGERLAEFYQQIRRKGGAEVRKGGEHHAVRISEHGGGGGIR